MRNAVVIDAIRDKYRLKELLEVFHMSKSSYCYQRAAMRAPDKYESVTIEIRKYLTIPREDTDIAESTFC